MMTCISVLTDKRNIDAGLLIAVADAADSEHHFK